MGGLNEKWMKRKGNTDDYEQKENKVTVRFDHVRTIILLYGAAAAIAFVLLAAEKVVYWLKAQQLNRFPF